MAEDGGWGGGALRNTRGQFVSARNYRSVDVQEVGANRGNQQFVTDRYEVDGVSLSQPSIQHWLAQPWVRQAVQAQADLWQSAANQMATVPGTYYGQIVYWGRSVSSGGWVTQDALPELGPVAVVYCENYPSVIDDRLNSTLLKVSNMVASGDFNESSGDVGDWDDSDSGWSGDDYGPPSFGGAGSEW